MVSSLNSRPWAPPCHSTPDPIGVWWSGVVEQARLTAHNRAQLFGMPLSRKESFSCSEKQGWGVGRTASETSDQHATEPHMAPALSFD